MEAATATRPPSSGAEQDEETRELREKIVERVRKEFEPYHRQYREQWDRLDSSYHAKRERRSLADNDRDVHGGVMLHKVGEPFHVPLAFSTIETVMPRILSSAPEQIAKPLDADSVPACKPIADLINQQQRNLNYELKLQPTVRRALKFGLGIQKVTWCEKKRKVPMAAPTTTGMTMEEREVVEYAGPMVEDVDIYDFFWDPAAKSIEDCQDLMHRTWRPFAYVKEKVENGEWAKIDLEAAEGMGKSAKRVEAWKGRLDNQGISMSEGSTGKWHEVWEYHKGPQVTIILNDEFVVANDTNPYWHRAYPFQAFRPTIVEGQLPGKGEIEPLEDLIAELDSLRSQRRDAAAYAIDPIRAYTVGFIDKKDLKQGPGVWLPVRGDVREGLQQLPTQDLPGSGYAEEASIKRDIEQTSGISESQMGGSGSGDTAGTETATGMQLVQQAANARIAGKARLMLLEMMRPAAWQFLQLNRQHMKPGQPVRIDDPSVPDGYRFLKIDPQVLNANVELVPEEHSTEPENRVQRINDANMLTQTLATNPDVDQKRSTKFLLEAYGIRDIDAWFLDQNAPSPEAFAEAFRRMQLEGGATDEEAAMNSIEAAQLAMQIQEEMDAAMEAGGEQADPTQPPVEDPGAPPPQESAAPEQDKGQAYPQGVKRAA